MQKHLRMDDIERYISASEDEADLDWFEEILEHVMACEFCRKNIAKRLHIEDICEEDGVALQIGLRRMAQKIPRKSVGEFGAMDRRYSANTPYTIAASQNEPSHIAACETGKLIRLEEDLNDRSNYVPPRPSDKDIAEPKKSFWQKLFHKKN